LKTKNVDDELRYKAYKNKLTSILRYCEKQYYSKQLSVSKGNIKKTWNIINSLIKPKRENNVEFDELRKVRSLKDVANGFNNFFTDIGPNLARKISPSPKDVEDFLKNRNTHNMFLSPVTVHELLLTVNGLQSKKSKDCLGLNMSLIKDLFPNIVNPLLDICNKSLQQGIFPDKMKVAKVIPIFKAGDKSCYSNYRPISLLPQFSKILEKIYTNRLDNFLSKHEIISTNQYGFQKNCSTSAAVIELVEQITDNIENNLITAGIFIDLQKAFDTVNHDILLRKLEHYGIRGVALDWAKSYLTNRQQYVTVNEINSDKRRIECGVPQGSVLGPKFFLIYINDISHISDLLKFILFADDTTILCSHNNINDLIKTANTELNKLCHWFSANKLSLNINKTNYMLFSTKHLIATDYEHTISMCNTNIERVDACKFLGVHVDDKLNWKKQICQIQAKLSKTLGILYRTRNLLEENTLKTLYNSLFLPYLNYCCEIWGNTLKTNLRPIELLQKKALRIICNASRYECTTPLFERLNLLKFKDLVKWKTASVMQKVFLEQMPKKIQQYFEIKKTKYPRRHLNKFTLNPHRTRLKSLSLSVIGVQTWNKLDFNTTTLNSNALFKFELKQLLIANYST
jgi:hypothetical protein